MKGDNPFLDMAEGKIGGLFGMRQRVNPHPASKPLSQYATPQPQPAPRLEDVSSPRYVQQLYPQYSHEDTKRLLGEMEQRLMRQLKFRLQQKLGKSDEEILKEQIEGVQSQLDVLEGEGRQILEQMQNAYIFNSPQGDKSWDELREIFHERRNAGFTTEALNRATELIEGAKVLLLLSLQNAANYEKRYDLMLGGNDGEIGMVSALKERINALETENTTLKKNKEEVQYAKKYQELAKRCLEKGVPIEPEDDDYTDGNGEKVGEVEQQTPEPKGKKKKDKAPNPQANEADGVFDQR